MLLQIRDYIYRVGVVSTQQLTREFRLELEALQPMLNVWIRKGIISKIQNNLGCQSKKACFKCPANTLEYYQSI